MGLWEEMFERLGQGIGQILLTRNDIADRTQYLNAKNTLDELLTMGFIPIVNENDTLAVSEIKFGDNDTLSAITAGMVGADYLFLMTDVDCLYSANPRTNPDAKPIEVVQDIAELERAVDVSSAGSSLGTGGMGTKIVAARLATAAGVTTIITRSSRPGNVAAITRYLEARKAEVKRAKRRSGVPLEGSMNGEAGAENSDAASEPPPLHTRFLPSGHRVRDRHFWLLHGLSPHGTLYVDHGAARALAEGRGLLPVGVIEAEGTFAQQECVRIVETSRAAPATTSETTTPPQVDSSTLPLEDQTPEPASAIPPTSAVRPPHHRSTSSTTSFKGIAHAPIDFPSPSHSPTPSGAPSPLSSQILQRPLSLHGPSSSSTLLNPGRSGTEREIGRALVNYSAIEIKRIVGLKSTDIESVLGWSDTEYVAFRENVALFLDVRVGAGKPVDERANEGAEGAGKGRKETDDGRGFEGENAGVGSSGMNTPVPGTPSGGRLGMGLGGYVEG